MKTMRLATVILLVTGAFFSACFNKGAPSTGLEINLYSGIRQLANIGDSLSQVQQVNKWSLDRLTLPGGADDEAVRFTEAYSIPEIGTRIYFRDGRVALIEVQEPFNGSIQGKPFKLFDFRAPPEKNWEEILIAHFGPPIARASGGRFSSESLFYSWGDLSYNHMGTNELAVYRDPAISNFRQRHFGRTIGTLFSH